MEIAVCGAGEAGVWIILDDNQITGYLELIYLIKDAQTLNMGDRKCQ